MIVNILKSKTVNPENILGIDEAKRHIAAYLSGDYSIFEQLNKINDDESLD